MQLLCGKCSVYFCTVILIFLTKAMFVSKTDNYLGRGYIFVVITDVENPIKFVQMNTIIMRSRDSYAGCNLAIQHIH